MQKKKESILAYRFDDLSFNQLWNRCKHQCPWLGQITICNEEFTDICHNEKRMVFRDMLIPVFNNAQDMLLILAKSQNVSLTKYSI